MATFFSREQQQIIAAAMRDSRPYILNEKPTPATRIAWQWTRDTYVNACESLANMLAQNAGGFAVEEREIFLSNCRAIEIKPFHCMRCGQHITDGKPCGHGRRDELGIV